MPTTGERFERAVSIMARLRAPGGCPWDREQTFDSIKPYTLEEAYEVLEAIDNRDWNELPGELGDLLLQVVFHSQMAQERGRFTISDVIREIHDKLIRRHPHVFGEAHAKDAAEVLRNWEQIKAQERLSKTEVRGNLSGSKAGIEVSLLDGVSRALPATLEGFQLTRKASRIGFDWKTAGDILEKMGEETRELQIALDAREQSKVEEELGDLLFAAVNLARFLKVDPEIALKKANAKFSQRFRFMEKLAREGGGEFKDLPREEMEALWELAKQTEQNIERGGERAKR